MAKKVQGKKLVWVIGNAECSQWYQIDPNLEPIRYHSERLDVPYSPNQFLAMDFFCRFLQQYCSTTFFFMEIFQNEICWLQRKNKYNKYVFEKLRFIVANPELGTLSTQCDWILGATYVSMCGWLGRGGFSPVFSKLPPTGTELLIHLLCPQHHGLLWWILSKN